VAGSNPAGGAPDQGFCVLRESIGRKCVDKGLQLWTRTDSYGLCEYAPLDTERVQAHEFLRRWPTRVSGPTARSLSLRNTRSARWAARVAVPRCDGTAPRPAQATDLGRHSIQGDDIISTKGGTGRTTSHTGTLEDAGWVEATVDEHGRVGGRATVTWPTPQQVLHWPPRPRLCRNAYRACHNGGGRRPRVMVGAQGQEACLVAEVERS